MSKEFYLKPMATILISAVIATAASALIAATYFKPRCSVRKKLAKLPLLTIPVKIPII